MAVLLPGECRLDVVWLDRRTHGIHLEQGEKRRVSFVLSPADLALVDIHGMQTEAPGEITLFVGGGQPRYASGVSHCIEVIGDPYQLH